MGKEVAGVERYFRIDRLQRLLNRTDYDNENYSFCPFAAPHQSFGSAFAMRAVGREVTLLMINNNLKRVLEVELWSPEHALDQHFALGRRQRRRLFLSLNRRRTRK